MAGALVRGGAGSEIALRDILPPHLRGGLVTRRDTERYAREWERANPGCVVVCDWELFDDADIAMMNEGERSLALADRQFLAQRREAATKHDAALSPRGGDPDRARELLRRARNDIERLDVRATGYKERFEDLAKQINEYEDVIGDARTRFDFKKPEHAHVEQPPIRPGKQREIEEKVERYRTLPYPNRKASIEKGVDLLLVQALFEVETDQALRDLLALKVTELREIAKP